MHEGIVVKSLTKIFPGQKKPALDSISVSLPKGNRIGIVGPDGAGKTTLLRLIAGLLLPTKGTVHLLGVDVHKNTRKIPSLIGYMPQKFGLYEDLTVLENLSLYANLQGVAKEQRKELFAQLLSFSALESFQDRLAGNLSGGMKQKLGLSCALLKKPKVLLLDEPTVGVDPLSRRELWQMVSHLLQEEITVLWSTSYLEEAELCDETLLLHEGSVLFYGPPKMLTEKMTDRVFLVQGLLDKRVQLSILSQDERVLDVTVQSEALRLVLKQKNDMFSIEGGTIEKTPPRFEDAFIDLLRKNNAHKKIPSTQEIIHTKNDKAIVIEAKDLVKIFGTFTAVKGINFQVKPGEIFGLLGPNGAGKSTTFKMLCGLLRPSSGGAYVSGLSLEHAPCIARGKVGYMAQKFSLYGSLSVLQNLRFFAGIYPIPKEKRKEAIESVIEAFGLQSCLTQMTNALPLGYKQRLALSCALIHQPDVLFLDEPTAGVDPLTRREFWMHINSFVQKGMTVMVTTHFMDEAEYCDHIGLILAGELMHLGTPTALKNLAKSASLPSPTLEDAFLFLSSKRSE